MSRYCEQCGKAKKACICKWIQTIDAKTQLCILQHPSEVNRAIGTARILSLSLANSAMFVGEDFSQHEALNALLDDPTRDVWLVYPSDTSTAITELAAREQNVTQTEKSLTLILLDGTWKKAYKMWQLSTNLHTLPTVNLDNVSSGNYRIRKSPREAGVSTVEAGYLALTALEGNKTDFTPLLATFNRMIEFQIQQMPVGVFEKNYG
ncbi:tRNA-uridine aminocarboxypropyltransferase [Photobacterium sanguinicancri]|uniref:tRNA-uridine aminocarboxypropyltransferase n=1 Tax=Photobacterium sanguinicancri TaxID=875932 RepID=A0AAW7Y2D8_9GAMM|nr:tRNA-uridine aminocarboxypropyltransferase [Photobacterium sanguinicancri]MDO6499574.1 tRNA-uridine aminocarboxypropyltransferase [Photobacterium sanguinicancri]MDO6542532.1 tRNA-uridine aminocarboxypropyltransferase [Photobacterium sanguinicancri]